MPSLGRNEADFNVAIETAQKAVQEAIAAIHNMGEIIAQVLKSIQESEKKAKQALAGGLTQVKSGAANKLDFKPFAKNMDTQAKNVSNQNEKLQKALGALNLMGQPPAPTTTRLIQNQLKKLDSAIQTTSKTNEKLNSFMRTELVLNGKPKLDKKVMEKAVEKTNAVLKESKNTVLKGSDPEQLNKVLRSNLKEVMISGHHHPAGQNKPTVVQTAQVLNRSLGKLHVVNLRYQAQSKVQAKPLDQDLQQEVTEEKAKKRNPRPGSVG